MGDKSTSKEKPPETRNKRTIKRALSNFSIWIIVSLVFTFIFFTIEEFTGNVEIIPRSQRGGINWNWAHSLSLIVAIIGLNLASADILRHFIKQHGRNVIAWTTSIIVFTPFITAIAYLLTCPKNQKFTSLVD